MGITVAVGIGCFILGLVFIPLMKLAGELIAALFELLAELFN
jgi:hypothetical protein